MNPKDDTNSNWDLSLPFKDRFALALPITMPDYESLSTIGKKDKSSTTKQDELPFILKEFDIDKVQKEIKEMRYSEDAELFINIIISSYRLCDRIAKESNDTITVEKGLCDGCHYNAPEKVCNKILNPLSVRVKEDLYRYGQALAWFLGDSEVTLVHIKTIAPFMIWHRSTLSKKFKEENRKIKFEERVFFLNNDLDSTKELIDKIEFEFEGLKPFLKKFDKVKQGKLSQIEFEEFISKTKLSNTNFLIIKKEIIPILEREYKPVYNEIIRYNKMIDEADNLVSLNLIKEELLGRYEIPNRQYLSDLIEKKRRKVGSHNLEEMKFKIPFDTFINLVGNECDELNKIIKKRFHTVFNPQPRDLENLADLSESEYNLAMEKVSNGDGTYSLRFTYRGKKDSPIYIFLNKHHVS